jgi:Glycosyltransferase family 87
VMLVRQRARLLVAGALVAYFALFEALGGHDRWGRLGVPTASLTFLDLRNVLSAWECDRRGIAVLPVNPCDPYHRPADFPRIWLLPSFLGIGPGSAVTIGILLALVFFVAAVLVVPAGAGVGTGLAYVLALCSPAVMLGVERGNPDLLLFPLVLGAVVVTTRTLGRQVATAALLVLVSFLKFYPVLAAGFLVRRATRASLAVAAVVVTAFLVYVAATYHQIHEILVDVPQSNVLTYGVRRMTKWFANVADRLTGGYSWYRPWDILLLAIAVLVGWLASRRLRARLSSPPSDAGEARDLDLFWAGACIYVGSYMVFLSHDYRLIFLLLAVPQIVRWTRARHGLAYVTVPALLATMWLDEWTRMPVLRPLLDWWTRTATVRGSPPLTVAVIAQYVLFGCLVAWLLATFPRGLTRLVRR